MKAMVLAAGLGTRMRPLSDLLAKPALPVLNRPLLHWTLELLARHGIRDVLVNTHHRPETVERAVGSGRRFGLRVRYAHEPEILGSGGGPRKVRAFLGDEPALLVNGDCVFDFDLTRLVRRHRRSGALATLALKPNPDPRRYRPVVCDAARLRPLHPAVCRGPRGERSPCSPGFRSSIRPSWSACPRALPTSWPRSTRRSSPRAGSSEGCGCAAPGSTSARLASTWAAQMALLRTVAGQTTRRAASWAAGVARGPSARVVRTVLGEALCDRAEAPSFAPRCSGQGRAWARAHAFPPASSPPAPGSRPGSGSSTSSSCPKARVPID